MPSLSYQAFECRLRCTNTLKHLHFSLPLSVSLWNRFDSIWFDLVIGIRFCHLIRISIGGKRLTTRKIVAQPKTATCRLIAFPFGSLNTKRKHTILSVCWSWRDTNYLKKSMTEQKTLTHSAVTWVKHQTKWFNLNFQCCHLNRRFALFLFPLAKHTRQTHIYTYLFFFTFRFLCLLHLITIFHVCRSIVATPLYRRTHLIHHCAHKRIQIKWKLNLSESLSVW